MILRSPYTRLFSAGAGLVLAGSVAAVAAITPTPITRVSLPIGNTPGVEANARSFGPVSLTSNGRLVAFSSLARNFYAPDTNVYSDIYIRDQSGNFTSMVSLGNPAAATPGSNRVIPNGNSSNPSVSPTSGRFVAFESLATNLVTGDTNTASDIFVRDRFGDVVRASVNFAGGQGPNNIGSFAPSVSDPQFDVNLGGDRLFVAYHSAGNNLSGTTNPGSDIYVTEIGPGFFNGSLSVQDTQRVSLGFDGTLGDGDSQNATISADGRYVAYESTSTNLVEDDANFLSDIFVTDTLTGQTEIISAETDDTGAIVTEGDGDSYLPYISPNGRFVAYVSNSAALDTTDTNGLADVYLYDRFLKTTTRVSTDPLGEENDFDSGVVLDQQGLPGLAGRPSVTDDGRFVTFVSDATNLDPNDENETTDVFLWDAEDQGLQRLSLSSSSIEDGASIGAAISGSGNSIAFESSASNLIGDDNNLFSDIFTVGTGVGGNGGETNVPVADAGLAQDVEEMAEVTLDGTLSSDPEGENLTYAWRQVDNGEDDDEPQVVLDTTIPEMPTFTAPLVSVPTKLVFELTVTDESGNVSEPATVEINVDVASAGQITGRVEDGNGQGVQDALVQVVREDGEEAESVLTDGAGFFTINNVRVGPNFVTVSAAGFEPVVSDVQDVESGQVLEYNVTLEDFTATLLGSVRLQNNSALAGATVTLLSANGQEIASAVTDSAGEYLLNDLDNLELDSAATLRVQSSAFPTWTVSDFEREPGQPNRRDFRFGRLEVTVDVNPTKLRKKLNGTNVFVKLGSATVAQAGASSKVRKVVFPNVPSGTLRIQATNTNLGGVSDTVTISEGGVTKRTLKLRRSIVF